MSGALRTTHPKAGGLHAWRMGRTILPHGTPDPITEAPSRRGILAAMLAEPIALPIENVARRDALVPGLAR